MNHQLEERKVLEELKKKKEKKKANHKTMSRVK